MRRRRDRNGRLFGNVGGFALQKSRHFRPVTLVVHPACRPESLLQEGGSASVQTVQLSMQGSDACLPAPEQHPLRPKLVQEGFFIGATGGSAMAGVQELFRTYLGRPSWPSPALRRLLLGALLLLAAICFWRGSRNWDWRATACVWRHRLRGRRRSIPDRIQGRRDSRP
jgi:hypothetical protein